MNLGLNSKRALILGSSRGLGYGIAKSLAAEKARIAIVGRDQQQLADLAKELSSNYATQVIPITCDLAKENCIEIIQTAIDKHFGGLDILINNSGGPPLANVTEVTDEDWKSYFNSMVLRIMTITNCFIPYMTQQNWGRILSISSSGIIQPIRGLAISNTLRASLITWAKTLANEVAMHGITVNTIIPGRIHTDRVDKIDSAIAARTKQSKEEVTRKYLAMIPLGRYGTVEEFAAVATFLVSELASYVTGSLFRVDGGLIASI